MSKTTDKVIALEQEQNSATLNNSRKSQNNIYKNLAKFQQECPVIHKGTKGYGYSYADLPTIFNVINPILEKYDLVFSQPLNENKLTTILYHTKSGEKLESSVTIPQDVQLKGMNAFQVYGSAITYFRRYALSSMLGIITDKDTDASGEQIYSKPKLNTKQMESAIKKVKANEITISKVKQLYDVTESQVKQLELAYYGR